MSQTINTGHYGVDLSKLLARLAVIASILSSAFAVALCLGLAGVVHLTVAANVIAFASCLVGALTGHVLSEYPKGNDFIMARLTTSMFVRAGLPLIVVVFTKFALPDVFSPGLVYIVVLFYLFGLASEAVLSVIRLKLAQNKI